MSQINFGDIGSGIEGIAGGVGDLFAAGGFNEAAKLANQNAQYVKLSTGIQLEQQDRTAFRVLGATEAAAGANSFSMSGSALDTFKSNTQQLSLNKALTGLQGDINMNAWLEKASADQAQASAATAGGIGGILGGITKVAAAAALFA